MITWLQVTCQNDLAQSDTGTKQAIIETQGTCMQNVSSKLNFYDLFKLISTQSHPFSHEVLPDLKA